MSIKGDLVWFLEAQDAPPERIHAREIWHNEEGGSLLHAPAWSGEMRDLLEGSPRAARTLHTTISCEHGGLHPLPADATFAQMRAHEAACENCHGTGRRPRDEERYRRPMHAALNKIAGDHVPPALPHYDVVLRQVAMAQGDLTRAVDVLATRWPAMAAPPVAIRHIAEALRRCRRVFRDEPPPRYVDAQRRDLSDAQLDAEAVA